ncbi:MAG: lipocalin family protein [Flavobacteriaceae bacterium]|nr:lipocalin family protein [Flavobacteriaceae bacterium]
MKKFILLSSLFASCWAFAQSIIGEWKVQKVLWNTPENSYALTPILEKAYRYGNFIEFKEDKTFVSYYSAPCGNDCFPSSKGTFEFIGKDKIELTIKEIAKNGMCSEPIFQEKGNWNLGIYTIKKTEKGIDLIQNK